MSVAGSIDVIFPGSILPEGSDDLKSPERSFFLIITLKTNNSSLLHFIDREYTFSTANMI